MPVQSQKINRKVKNTIYNINEIFYSIQGEGAFTGTSAVFVRFAGCNMGCNFCDSKFAKAVNLRLTAKQILQTISKYPTKTVTLTGGEPLEQDILPLFSVLSKKRYNIHIESNGFKDIDTSLVYWLTISPKKKFNKKILKKADELKIIINRQTTDKQLKSLINQTGKNTLIYIQPQDNKKEHINKCLKIISVNPQIKLSVQLHKMLNIK